MNRCPVLIETMLICHYAAEPQRQIQRTMATDEAVRWLAEKGLIDGKLAATDKGRAWVNAICETPLPVPVTTWQIPDRTAPDREFVLVRRPA